MTPFDVTLFDILLYFTAFGSVLALFTSVIALIGWISIKLVRALTAPPPEPTEQTERSREDWNPNQWKRAGQ
jgi:hypothetical protein